MISNNEDDKGWLGMIRDDWDDYGLLGMTIKTGMTGDDLDD